MNALLKKNGFSLVEAVVVAMMVSILATIAVPPYLQHLRHARGSEAVSAMLMIRQALRDYHINNNTFFDIGSGNIPQALPTSVSSGTPTPSDAGVEVDVGVAHYYSNASYAVDATTPASSQFTNPDPVDFIITVDGSASVACGSSDCATDASAISNYRLEMDNTDRAYISYDSGTTWYRY